MKKISKAIVIMLALTLVITMVPAKNIPAS